MQRDIGEARMLGILYQVDRGGEDGKLKKPGFLSHWLTLEKNVIVGVVFDGETGHAKQVPISDIYLIQEYL